jgi:hypothetical protein
MGTIQLKNVPNAVQEELRRRAARSRMSVRDYVLRLIEMDQRTAPLDEWLDALATREPTAADVDVVALIRAGREERTEQILRAIDGDPGS